MKYKEYRPNWVLNSGENNTFRYCSKWGNHTYFTEPSEALYVFIKEHLDLTDEDFMHPQQLGDKAIPDKLPIKLSADIIAEIEFIVGKVNVFADAKTRIMCAYGKSAYDNMRLRQEIVDKTPDIVIAPSTEEQIITVFELCYKRGIAIYPSGGRTNTNGTTECYKGGVMIDLKRNYNKVLTFNEVDQTITVMTGITGPELEEILNNAPDYFEKVSNKYTCGHMPQSFEFSTVGGWIMSRSYGGNYARYGDISDILVSAKYITSKGVIDTASCDRSLPLPSLDEVMIGSRGEYGVLLSATLRLRRHYPDSKKLFSYLFRNFDSAVRCTKEIMQAEGGTPSALRVCDSDDTEIIMRMNAVVDKGIIAPFVRKLNGNDDRCLVIGTVEGSKAYSRMVMRDVSRTSARYGGVSSTSYLSKRREKSMFSDAYIRDLMLDYNVIMDDICCMSSWSNVFDTYQSIKEIVAERPHTFSMVHLKKMSAQGCMVVCEYIGKYGDAKEFYDYRQSLIERISAASGIAFCFSMGKDWEQTAGDNVTKAHKSFFAALKKYFDPKSLINPK